MIARFTHRPAHSLGRRLLDSFRSLFVGGLGKSQRVYFVQINGQRYKRVVFGDTLQADRVAHAIETCGNVVVLPRLFHQHENELWLEYVRGPRPQADDEHHREALARLFAALYAFEPRTAPLEDTAIHGQLHNDLLFLYQLGVLDGERLEALQARAETLRPDQVQLGPDYRDPVLKNFVIKDNDAVIIDLESIELDALLGTGVAKCGLHWLDRRQRGRFADRIVELGAPDFRIQLDYAELALIAGWTKRKLLAGKRRRIQLSHFDRCLE